MEQTIWKSVIGYEGMYEVSNDGAVRSISRYTTCRSGKKQMVIGKVRAQWVSNGYKCVSLCNGGDKKFMQVHRLVALNFIPNPESKPQVNHIDGNKHNNHVDNLEWATQDENMSHAVSMGLIQKGEAKRQSMLAALNRKKAA